MKCQMSVFVLLVGTAAVTLRAVEAGPKLCPGVSGQPSCVCKSQKGLIDLTPLSYDNSSAPW